MRGAISLFLPRSFCLSSTIALHGAEQEEGAVFGAQGAGWRREAAGVGRAGRPLSGASRGRAAGATRCPVPALSRSRTAYRQVTSLLRAKGRVG